MNDTLAPPEILIVDDEPDITIMLRDALAREHLTCTLAHSSAEVESLIRLKKFDVIVTDIALPDMTGLDLLQFINNVSPASKTILITGQRRIDWVQQALRDGAFDFLEKPLDLTLFQETVQKALRLRQADTFPADPHQLPDRQCLLLLDRNGIICFVSENFARITGMNPVVGIGLHFNQLLAQTDLTLDHLVRQAGLSRKVVLNLHRPDESSWQAEIEFHPIALEQGDLVYLIRLIDLSPSPALKDSLPAAEIYGRPRVSHDQLTGLPSRAAFEDELRRLCYRCRSCGRSVALLLLEVNDFERLNTEFGFARGDDLLVDLSHLLRRRIRVADFLARLFGAQFVILMPETDGPAALAMADRLADEVKARVFASGYGEHRLSVSVGIAEYTSSSVDGHNKLLEKAQQALRSAQSLPAPGLTLWQPSLGLGEPAPNAKPDSSSATPAQLDQRLRPAYLEMTRSLVAAVEAKDPYTKNHSLNVADYAEFLARALHLPEDQIGIIRCAATLHDVGKIGIPDAILTKPGRLTDAEFALIRQHPLIGADILSSSSFLAQEALLVRHHHERFDGTGYPDGLPGSQVSIGARILQVADAMDAMICTRSYRQGFNLQKVIAELHSHSASQFDPKIVPLAVDLLRRHPEKVHFPVDLLTKPLTFSP